MPSLPFRIKKSAGVRVTPAVHRLIRQGDAARDAARWPAAAAAYRAALVDAPTLHHIRLQLGHALKQAGELDAADAAYAEAARLRPDDAEPVLHRAHLAKQRDRIRAAACLFIETLSRQNDHAGAEADLIALLAPVAAIPPEALRALLREDAAPAREAGVSAPSTQRPLLFDVTDLVGHFRHQRVPSGIQRVEIEVLDTALRTLGAGQVRLCCVINGRDGWIGVPLPHLRPLVTLAKAGSDPADPAWQAARARLFFHLALDDRLAIPPRAILVNLGTSLWVADYLRMIRTAKAAHGISYVPTLFDLIPAILPHYSVPGMRADFAAWLGGVFDVADGFLAISRSTAADLLAVARLLGHSLPLERIEVVPLDADFRADPAEGALPPSALAGWGLQAGQYALLVSTIEPRKNHMLALDAWAELIRTHGAEAVPTLVCVGRDGWMNEAVFARLAADPALIAAVTIIHRVSDAELALLYRASRFTIYPSLYEGWGLPVTESLCHGRVPVVADNSSLPEASAGLAAMFESGSLPALVQAIERVAFDDGWRTAQEARIAAEFIARPWAAVAAQILAAVARLAEGGTPQSAPTARRGAYHAMRAPHEAVFRADLANGEVFRFGEGWLWPEAGGCRTTPTGGTLRLRVAGATEDIERKDPMRVHLHLRGLASIDCTVALVGDGSGGETRTVVPAGGTAWASLDIAPDVDHSILVRGDASEAIWLSTGGVARVRHASVTVLGFLVAAAADAPHAMAQIDRWHEQGG